MPPKPNPCGSNTEILKTPVFQRKMLKLSNAEWCDLIEYYTNHQDSLFYKFDILRDHP